MKAYPIYMLVYITAIAYSWLMHVIFSYLFRRKGAVNSRTVSSEESEQQNCDEDVSGNNGAVSPEIHASAMQDIGKNNPP